MSKENIKRVIENIKNYLFSSQNEPQNIEITERGDLIGASSSSVRIDMGLFYTDQEYEEMRERVLNKPMP